MAFSDKLLSWYDENARSLPWRGIDNPYYIWLSEIILQQTRIEQGMDYYLHFISRYPTVFDLANASEEQVLKSWQGLGYYSRARNLHLAAQYIAYELNGVFPNTYDDILRLKGVGRYTAAAIASFAFHLPYPVIDGNVYRFISRYFGIDTPIGTEAAYREFESLLLGLMDRGHPDLFNQALMDFGSVFCKPVPPKQPSPVLDNCAQCVFCGECAAFRSRSVSLFPVKVARTPVQTRFFFYLFFVWDAEGETYTCVHQRSGKDIWNGLFEFPLVELPQPFASDSELMDQIPDMASRFGLAEIDRVALSDVLTHKLTHRTILARFIKCHLSSPMGIADPSLRLIPISQLQSLPVSRLMDRYLSLW